MNAGRLSVIGANVFQRFPSKITTCMESILSTGSKRATTKEKARLFARARLSHHTSIADYFTLLSTP
jgi:hypothetical protein